MFNLHNKILYRLLKFFVQAPPRVLQPDLCRQREGIIGSEERDLVLMIIQDRED